MITTRSPSLAFNTYLLVDDLGEFGQIWREADPEATERENVLQDFSAASTATRCAQL